MIYSLWTGRLIVVADHDVLIGGRLVLDLVRCRTVSTSRLREVVCDLGTERDHVAACGALDDTQRDDATVDASDHVDRRVAGQRQVEHVCRIGIDQQVGVERQLLPGSCPICGWVMLTLRGNPL